MGDAYRYASLGFTFAAGIVLFMAAGYGLDRWLGTIPFGTIAGTVLGAVLGFLSVYRRIMGMGKR
jgi:ATP synthase protein I